MPLKEDAAVGLRRARQESARVRENAKGEKTEYHQPTPAAGKRCPKKRKANLTRSEDGNR